MDAAALVRAARRQQGLSQAGLAARAGVSARTVAALESGTADPRWSTVARLLAVAAVEPGAVPAVPAASRYLVPYLLLSTTQRLRLVVPGSRASRASPSPWRELAELSSYGVVRLDGGQAVGVWLPVTMSASAPWAPLPRPAVEPPLCVLLHPWSSPSGRRRRRWEPAAVDGAGPEVDLSLVSVPGRFRLLSVTVVAGPPPKDDVPVALEPRARVHVPPPLALALHPACAESAGQLRRAGQLLHEQQLADAAGRQRPAHRDPDEEREAGRVMTLRRYDRCELPSGTRSRAWRLDEDVGLAVWLSQHPVPRTA